MNRIHAQSILDEWAQVIVRSLASGGIVIVEDEHPLAMTLSGRGREIVMTDDYFQRGRIELGPPGWTHVDDKGQGTERQYEFVWPTRLQMRSRHCAASERGHARLGRLGNAPRRHLANAIREALREGR